MLPHLQRLNLLLAELKRRQVFRAVAVYAVGAWAVIEVTSTILPVFLLPDWIERGVVVVMLLGFPVIMVLAWAFDLTTEGVQKTRGVGGDSPAAEQFARSRAFRGTLVLLVLAMTSGAGWVSWQVWLKPGAPRGPGYRPSQSAGKGGAEGKPIELDPSKLAVLYFEDFSAGGELGYVANGITEALIHELSQVETLRVVSRNGVKPYRNPTISVDSLARVLGVGSLVEGSVEGTPKHMGVTVQLIDGETGLHLLSERIEGRGEDVLALRDSLVERATELVGRKLGRELRTRREHQGSTDAEAWALYQRAQRLREDADTLRWALGDTLSARRTLIRADSLFGEAAARDSGWISPILARGWTLRTRSGLLSASQSFRDRALLEEGLGQAEEALRLDPGNPEALELRGSLRVDLFRREGEENAAQLAESAEEDLRNAAAADPSLVFVWVSLADLLRLQGRFQEASVAARRALEKDPFLINAEKETLFILAQVWLDLGDVARATEWNDEGRRRFPAEPAFAAGKLVILAGEPGPPEAVDTAYALLHELEKALDAPNWPFGLLQVAAVLAQRNMPDSAESLVRRVRTSGSSGPWADYFEANVRLHLGQPERALDLLTRFLDSVPQRRDYIARDWWWKSLRSEPRFKEMVESGEGEI